MPSRGIAGDSVQHLRRLLGEGHPGQEVIKARLDRKIGILKGEGGSGHGVSVTVAIDCDGMSNEAMASSDPTAA